MSILIEYPWLPDRQYDDRLRQLFLYSELWWYSDLSFNIYVYAFAFWHSMTRATRHKVYHSVSDSLSLLWILWLCSQNRVFSTWQEVDNSLSAFVVQIACISILSKYPMLHLGKTFHISYKKYLIHTKYFKPFLLNLGSLHRLCLLRG